MEPVRTYICDRAEDIEFAGLIPILDKFLMRIKVYNLGDRGYVLIATKPSDLSYAAMVHTNNPLTSLEEVETEINKGAAEYNHKVVRIH